MLDTQRGDKTIERQIAARIDGVEQLIYTGESAFGIGQSLCRSFALLFLAQQRLALAFFQHGGAHLVSLIAQAEDIGRLIQDASAMEYIDIAFAQSFDIEYPAADNIFEILDTLVRTGLIAGAFARHAFLTLAVGFAQDFGLQRARTDDRKFIRSGIGGTFTQFDTNDLRDDIAGALDAHHVADMDILARDLVGIVQGDIGHHHATDIDRLQPRHWRKRSHAADLNINGGQTRQGLLSRKLVGNGPARRARHEAQPALPVKSVDLIDHAIDIIAEAGTGMTDMIINLKQTLRTFDILRVRIDGKAPFTELFQRL